MVYFESSTAEQTIYFPRCLRTQTGIESGEATFFLLLTSTDRNKHIYQHDVTGEVGTNSIAVTISFDVSPSFGAYEYLLYQGGTLVSEGVGQCVSQSAQIVMSQHDEALEYQQYAN